MNIKVVQDEPGEEDQLALEILIPDTLNKWQAKATEDRGWAQYLLVLTALTEGIRRAPFSEEDIETVNVSKLLYYELECFADLFVLLYPDPYRSLQPFLRDALKRRAALVQRLCDAK